MYYQGSTLKGHSTSGRMNVCLKLVIHVEEMWNNFWIRSFPDWEKPENVFLAYVWKTTIPRMHLLRCPRRPRLPV